MKKYVGFRSNQWQYQGVMRGHLLPQLKALCPFASPPLSEGKKWQKLAIFSIFLNIFPQICILPPWCPPPKKKHKILVLPLGQIEVSLCKTGITNSFQAFPPCRRMRHSLWLELDCGLNSEAVRLWTRAKFDHFYFFAWKDTITSET